MILTHWVDELRLQGVVLAADGDALHVRGPREVLTEDLRSELLADKAALN